MKEVQTALRTAYISALSGISIDSVNIPVYDEYAPPSAPASYIIVTNQTDNEISNKQAFYNDASITVDINTSFAPNVGGKELSETIAGLVLAIIKPASRTQITMSGGFQVVTTRKDLVRTLSEDLPSRRVFRKIIIFTHKIRET